MQREGRRSAVWNYFRRLDKNMAQCHVCSAHIRYRGVTTYLHRHLQAHPKHRAELRRGTGEERPTEEDAEADNQGTDMSLARPDSVGVVSHLQCVTCGHFCRSHAHRLSHLAAAHPALLDSAPVGRLGLALLYQASAKLYHCNICFFTNKEYDLVWKHLLSNHCADHAPDHGGDHENKENLNNLGAEKDDKTEGNMEAKQESKEEKMEVEFEQKIKCEDDKMADDIEKTEEKPTEIKLEEHESKEEEEKEDKMEDSEGHQTVTRTEDQVEEDKMAESKEKEEMPQETLTETNMEDKPGHRQSDRDHKEEEEKEETEEDMKKRR